jgi:Kef-type K+ transport system membrane component KefB
LTAFLPINCPDQSTTTFIVYLFLLLACAVVAGEIAAHLGQLALVGQLLVGVALGPTLLGPYIHLTCLSPELGAIQSLAIIFILFMAGLEIDADKVFRMGWKTLGLGLAVFVIPFFATLGTLRWVFPGYDLSTELFLGLTLSITGLPVMGVMMVEFNLVNTKMGNLLMNAALINELTAVTIFAILIQVETSPRSDVFSVSYAVLSVLSFIIAMFLIALLLAYLRRTHRWENITQGFNRFWRSKQGNFAVLMVVVMGVTLFSQLVGLTYIVGAFFAGLLVSRASISGKERQSISRVFDTITWGFFIPLFFVFVGIQMDLHLLWPIIIPFLVVTAVAIAVKVITGTGIAKARGWSTPDSLAIGNLLSSRGAVALALAVVLYSLNPPLINTTMFTIIVTVGLLSSIVAPIAALYSWLSTPSSKEELLARMPALRHEATVAGQLRPPIDWEDIYPQDGLQGLKQWLSESRGNWETSESRKREQRLSGKGQDEEQESFRRPPPGD